MVIQLVAEKLSPLSTNISPSPIHLKPKTMFQDIKPLDQSLTPFLTDFFQVEKTQCLCYHMPSYPEGWVIQGLGMLKYQPEYQKSVNVIDSTLPIFTSTPENFDSVIAVSAVCLSVILSALFRLLN